MAFRAPSRATLRFLRSITHPSQSQRCLTCSHRLSKPDSPTSSSQSSNQDATTHFGFSSIPESEKAGRVGSVFTSVAPSYDKMNDLMSLGVHRLWKDYFVRSLDPGIPPNTAPLPSTTESPADPTIAPDPPSPAMTILDVAGGTGDIALRLLDHMALINNDTKSKVIVSDINPAMLEEGKRRLQHTSYAHEGRLEWLEADAQVFPTIEDNSIDLYTVAFGIRNMTNIPLALRTAYRVLKPGGVFACLEFGKVGNGVLDGVYKRWSFGAIPLIGQVVAGDRDSYQYLVESIEKFPEQGVFAGMIEKAGFLVPGVGGGGDDGDGGQKAWVDLTGGIAAVHKGIKPA